MATLVIFNLHHVVTLNNLFMLFNDFGELVYIKLRNYKTNKI